MRHGVCTKSLKRLRQQWSQDTPTVKSRHYTRLTIRGDSVNKSPCTVILCNCNSSSSTSVHSVRSSRHYFRWMVTSLSSLSRQWSQYYLFFSGVTWRYVTEVIHFTKPSSFWSTLSSISSLVIWSVWGIFVDFWQHCISNASTLF